MTPKRELLLVEKDSTSPFENLHHKPSLLSSSSSPLPSSSQRESWISSSFPSFRRSRQIVRESCYLKKRKEETPLSQQNFFPLVIHKKRFWRYPKTHCQVVSSSWNQTFETTQTNLRQTERRRRKRRKLFCYIIHLSRLSLIHLQLIRSKEGKKVISNFQRLDEDNNNLQHTLIFIHSIQTPWRTHSFS